MTALHYQDLTITRIKVGEVVPYTGIHLFVFSDNAALDYVRYGYHDCLAKLKGGDDVYRVGELCGAACYLVGYGPPNHNPHPEWGEYGP